MTERIMHFNGKLMHLKEQLSTLIELGLFEQAAIWSSMFCIDLEIERAKEYIYISWITLDGNQDNYIIIF